MSAVPLIDRKDGDIEAQWQPREITVTDVQTPQAYNALVKKTRAANPFFLCKTIEKIFEENSETLKKRAGDDCQLFKLYWLNKENEDRSAYRQCLETQKPRLQKDIIDLLAREYNYSLRECNALIKARENFGCCRMACINLLRGCRVETRSERMASCTAVVCIVGFFTLAIYNAVHGN